MGESANPIGELRQRVARIAGARGEDGIRQRDDVFALGHAGVDAHLGGGLARGRMHEICAGEPDDSSSAAAFAAMLAMRARRLGGGAGAALMWLRTEDAERRSGRLHGPGLAEIGLDPGGVVLAVAPDDVALLRSAGDAARVAGLDAIIVECWRNPRVLDLTASRRLVLAAERSGVTLLLLRIDATPVPGAADTRWQVRAAPSVALAADAPGHPAFDIELLRRRAGPAGMTWRMEWNRDDRLFQNRTAPLSGAVVPFPQRGSLADQTRRIA